MLVDALIVAKIRGIKRRNTDVLNSFCPLVEKNKSPSTQNDQGISRRLQWDEKDTGKSEVIKITIVIVFLEIAKSAV